MSQFEYEPLRGAQSFRLLQIQPARDHSSIISCSIWNDDHAMRAGAYTALSYTWGDAQVSVLIILDGRSSSIGKNLHEALLQLRNTHTGVNLWIDALCIDQESPNERTHQVAQMREIYSEAREVISWLGPALRGVDELFHRMKAHRQHCGGGFCNTPVPWQHFQQVEDLPYWDRVWIIQEIVANPRVKLICGEHTIAWNVFIDSLHSLCSGHFGTPENRPRARSLIDLGTWPRANVDLANALTWSTTSLASDQRDRIFALLGLIDQGSGREIVADYTMSPCRVFCLAIEALLRDFYRHNFRDHSNPTGAPAACRYYSHMFQSAVQGLPNACVANASGHAHMPSADDQSLHGDSDSLTCSGYFCASGPVLWYLARWRILQPTDYPEFGYKDSPTPIRPWRVAKHHFFGVLEGLHTPHGQNMAPDLTVVRLHRASKLDISDALRETRLVRAIIILDNLSWNGHHTTGEQHQSVRYSRLSPLLRRQRRPATVFEQEDLCTTSL